VHFYTICEGDFGFVLRQKYLEKPNYCIINYISYYCVIKYIYDS
jgi:hypothetical protein